MLSERYHLVVRWRARPESAASCAFRLCRTLDGLANAHRAFVRWNTKATSRTAASRPAWEMPPSPEELTQVFDDNKRCKDATREPWPEMGYAVTAWNGLDTPLCGILSGLDRCLRRLDSVAEPRGPRSVAGRRGKCGFDEHRCAEAGFSQPGDRWDPDCGNLVPQNYWKRAFAEGPYPLFRSGWMTYLAPQYASRVTPPSAAIVEPVAGGGMLLLATLERFSMDNAEHLAAADAIQAALAPIQDMVPPASSA